MTNMELAEEIEKLKKVTADYGYAEPRLLVRESLADQIIAALRRGPARPPSGEMDLATAYALAQTEIKGLQAERDLHYTRLAGLLFSGALDKYTGGDVQAWATEYTKKLTEAQARIAMLEEELRRSKNAPA